MFVTFKYNGEVYHEEFETPEELQEFLLALEDSKVE
jgi:hypothetical protein